MSEYFDIVSTRCMRSFNEMMVESHNSGLPVKQVSDIVNFGKRLDKCIECIKSSNKILCPFDESSFVSLLISITTLLESVNRPFFIQTISDHPFDKKCPLEGE